MTGLCGCPNCYARDFSSMDAAPHYNAEELKLVVFDARELWKGGNAAAATRMLAAHGLTMAHIWGSSPLYELQHFRFTGFIAERMHMRSVRVHLRVRVTVCARLACVCTSCVCVCVRMFVCGCWFACWCVCVCDYLCMCLSAYPCFLVQLWSPPHLPLIRAFAANRAWCAGSQL